MARLAVAHTKSTGGAGRTASGSPTGDLVVDIDLSVFTTMTQIDNAWQRIRLELLSGKELKP